MGRRTTSAVVPFKIAGYEVNDIVVNMRKEIDDVSDTAPPAIYNNWIYNFDIAEDYIDHNDRLLYCDLLEKDDIEIYIVNESEWAAGGGKAYCLFSVDKEALESICRDWGLDISSITENDVVQQTI